MAACSVRHRPARRLHARRLTRVPARRSISRAASSFDGSVAGNAASVRRVRQTDSPAVAAPALSACPGLTTVRNAHSRSSTADQISTSTTTKSQRLAASALQRPRRSAISPPRWPVHSPARYICDSVAVFIGSALLVLLVRSQVRRSALTEGEVSGFSPVVAATGVFALALAVDGTPDSASRQARRSARSAPASSRP